MFPFINQSESKSVADFRFPQKTEQDPIIFSPAPPVKKLLAQ